MMKHYSKVPKIEGKKFRLKVQRKKKKKIIMKIKEFNSTMFLMWVQNLEH
jgi:hypothetical protein